MRSPPSSASRPPRSRSHPTAIGAVSYLEAVQSQTTALTAQREALDLDTRQLRANVALIRALGGGWDSGDAQVARNECGGVRNLESRIGRAASACSLLTPLHSLLFLDA